MILAHPSVPDHLRRHSFDQHTWEVVLPVVNVVMAVTALTFSVFYFWIEAGRSDICVKTSGHWFYYVLTTLCYVWALTHFIIVDGWSTLTRSYAAYAVGYQVLMLRILMTTQRFHHDPIEACHAIKLAVYIIPFATVTGFLVLGLNGLTPFDLSTFGFGEKSKSTYKKDDDIRSPDDTTSNSNLKSSGSGSGGGAPVDAFDTAPIPPPPVGRGSSMSPPPMDEGAPPPPLDDSPAPTTPSSGGLLDDIKKIKLRPKPTEPVPKSGSSGGKGGGGNPQTDLMAAIAAKLKERRPHVEDWETE